METLQCPGVGNLTHASDVEVHPDGEASYLW